MNTSVVIPAFNAQHSIAETLRSVLVQFRPPLEVIVVDDGSTDGTGAEARSASPDITLISQENAGQGAARNAGARAAAGEAIFFLDADDVLLPHALEVLEGETLEYPDAGVFNPRYELLTDAPARSTNRLPPRHSYERRHLAQILLRNPLVGNALIRRQVWEEHPYSEAQAFRNCEDLELWVRLLLHDIPIRVPKPILFYRREGPHAATAQVTRMRQCRQALFRQLKNEFRMRPLEALVVRYQLLRLAFTSADVEDEALR